MMSKNAKEGTQLASLSSSLLLTTKITQEEKSLTMLQKTTKTKIFELSSNDKKREKKSPCESRAFLFTQKARLKTLDKHET